MLFSVIGVYKQTNKTIHQVSMNVACAIRAVTGLLAVGLKEWKTHLIIQKVIEEYWKQR